MLTRRNLSILLVCLLGAFGGSVLLNVWFWRQLRHYERLYFATRLDPLGTEGGYPDMPTTTQPPIIFYGDSRAHHWLLPAGPPGVSVLTRGRDGQSSRQALLRYATDVAPLRPAVLVLQLGVNDLMGLSLLQADRTAIIKATKANLNELIGRARADGTVVVVTTIFPPAAPTFGERLSLPVADRAAIEDVNTYLTSLAAPGVIIFDTVGILCDQHGWVQPHFKADMWHLNVQGYAALNAHLTPILNELER